ADDVVVAGAGVVAGKNATLARNGAITGNVTAEADGASLEGVDVLALQEDTFEVDGTTYTEWMPVGFASTDENGDYSLPVAAGTYRVGFFDYCWAEEECRHLTEFYDDVSTPEAGTDVTVTGSDVTPDIDAALAEGSTVSGTITDGDDAPVEDAEVTAYVEEDGEWTPVGGTWTDGNGDYRLLVADGSYRLGFSDPAEESFTEEFYDDSRTLEDADTIVVGGADVADVDATVGLLVPVENLAPPRVLDEDPQVGELVYAHPGVWTPASDDLDIEWFRSGSEEPIGSGIGVVVPAEALGETLTVQVTVRADDRIDGVASSEPSAPVTEGQLTSTVKPSVRGPLVAGATVEARDGSWSAAPDSYTYRWFQSGTEEPIGTDKQLVVPDGAVGQTLTVEVTAKKAGYADGVRSSEPTVAVTAAPTALEGTAPPRITGVVQVGRTITVDPGTWSQEPSGFHYQWWADGKVIPGVTGADYTVPAAMANKRIQVMVTAGVPGAIGTAWTDATTPVALGRITAERPRLTGKPKVGRKLRVRPAAAVPAAASVRVQWLVNGSVVPGATRPRLKLTRKHQGKRIRAQVVYSLPGYAPLVWRSAKVRIGK
ncbi:MAG TPA: carboxypeptidase regulatory-like domain-containing protein, partial [Acidimicrobiales bacterium]